MPDGGFAAHKCRGPWAYYVLAGRGPGGRRRQITRAGFSTKRQAELALKDVLARDDAEIAVVHHLTTGKFLQDWFDGKRSLRDTTRHGYESHLRLYLLPHLGHILLADLRPHHLDPMFTELLQVSGLTQRTVSTVRRVHATLRSALNTAVRRRLIPWNPALHVELPSATKASTEVWTPEQLGHFLDLHADHRLYALFHLYALTGLRRGEALGLRWSDIDLDEALLRVTRQLLYGADGLTFGPPKTRSGVRAVPLDAWTVRVLRHHAHRQRLDQIAWPAAWPDDDLVFTREDGEPLRPDSVSHVFLRLTAQASAHPVARPAAHQRQPGSRGGCTAQGGE